MRTAVLVAVVALAAGGAGRAQEGDPAEDGGPAGGDQQLRPRLEGRALVEALRAGGYVILLRNAATEPRPGPEPETAHDDCTGPRDLSAEGRRQAVLLGRALAALDIRIDRVLACPSCRCVDTGTLAFGAVARSEDLSLDGDLSAADKSRRAAQVRALLGTPPAEGFNSVLIAHTGVFLYSYGLDPKPEGVAHVFRPGAAGPPAYMGRIEPAEWAAVAGVSLEAPAP